MNKYIIDLLNKNGSIIIPGFGCLTVSNNQIVFNEFIQFNDGKLVNHVHQETGMDRQDIENQISKWYREILAEINVGNDFIIHGLGKFFKSTIDTIDFITLPDIKVSESKTRKVASIPIAIEDKIADLETQTNENLENSNFEYNTKKNTSKNSLDDMLFSSEIETLNRLTEEEETKNLTPFKSITDKQSDIAVPAKNVEEVVVDAIEAVVKENKASLPDEKKDPFEAMAMNNKKGNPKPTKAEKEDKQQKRGIFFYFKLLVLQLILGLAVYAYFSFDEISKFLGGNKNSAPIEIPADPVDPVDHAVTAELDDQAANESEKIEETIAVPAPERESMPLVQENIENIPVVSGSGKYHIVVGTFSVRTYADRLVQKIKDAGYDGKILLSSSSGYTVAFHSYLSQEEAQDNIEKAKSITGTSAYVLKK